MACSANPTENTQLPLKIHTVATPAMKNPVRTRLVRVDSMLFGAAGLPAAALDVAAAAAA